MFACLAVATAFGFSLTGLLRGVFLLSPTADVGLLPVVALGLMIARAQAPSNEPAIRDRYVDYAIGLSLLACALVLLLLFPAHASPVFWQRRLDLLSIPLFTAGAVAIIFGIRALWRVRAGMAFLFLVMLVPLTAWIEKLVGPSGAATSNGVFVGAKDTLGYLILGLALMNLASGRFLRKALWVAAGVGVSWTVAAAGDWALLIDRPGAGGDAPLHRIVEFAILMLSVFLMVRVFPLFGLRFRQASLANLIQRSPDPVGARRRPPYVGLSVVAAAAVLAFIGESSLPRYSAVLTETGAPRLEAGALSHVAVPGWSVQHLGPLPWVVRYYGPVASGKRYRLDCTCADPAFLSSTPAVIADDIVTAQDLPISSSQLALIEPIRGRQLINLTRIDLGNGVIGHAAVYRQSSRPDWIAVYWDWPVMTASGTHYEHFVVEASGSLAYGLRKKTPLPGPIQQVAMRMSDWLDGAPSQPIGESAARLRSDLASIARTIATSISGAAPPAEAGR